MEKINIQWFPGHMTKARRMITENVKLTDAVCEIIDARIPYSSRNPDIDELTLGKPRLIVINRSDQADKSHTKKWRDEFNKAGFEVLETDSKSGKGTAGFSTAVRKLLSEKIHKNISKGQTGKKMRVMVVGIPNVGKSSFINRVAKRKAAVTSDRPGVTRGKQWIVIDDGLELLDTPGILWPRFEDQTVAENLAFTGAIRDQIIDIETLAANLMHKLSELYPNSLFERYKLDTKVIFGGYNLLEQAARNRGFLLQGAAADITRMSNILLDEFRAGKLGQITLERVEDL